MRQSVYFAAYGRRSICPTRAHISKLLLGGRWLGVRLFWMVLIEYLVYDRMVVISVYCRANSLFGGS
jgi:hypothetical protein